MQQFHCALSFYLRQKIWPDHETEIIVRYKYSLQFWEIKAKLLSNHDESLPNTNEGIQTDRKKRKNKKRDANEREWDWHSRRPKCSKSYNNVRWWLKNMRWRNKLAVKHFFSHKILFFFHLIFFSSLSVWFYWRKVGEFDWINASLNTITADIFFFFFCCY